MKQDPRLRSYRLYRGQALTEAAMQIRLEKSKLLLKDIQQGRLSNVIWTDEKIFTIEMAHNSQNQRELLPASRYRSSQRRVLIRTLFPKPVMVWAGITLDKKTPLVFVDRSVKINAEVYQEKILRDILLPWVAQNFVSSQCVLHQDWAPAHSAYPHWHSARVTSLATGRRTSGHLTRLIRNRWISLCGLLAAEGLLEESPKFERSQGFTSEGVGRYRRHLPAAHGDVGGEETEGLYLLQKELISNIFSSE
ncbi:unnamed protein product [Heligmosomoides polygyrus]|uniref:DDE_3 domain-containing protein n=1 Tax=Heligmosomoides polygyrus TaxID=6339 RepID=A0A183F7W5_HELPZ|nr:unnamed protein product [Heligmosomoides polygyrus]